MLCPKSTNTPTTLAVPAFGTFLSSAYPAVLAMVMAMTNRRVAIVTGGGTGVGRAACTELAAEGWTIVAAGRTLKSLTATVESVESAGGTAMAVVCDVSQPDSVDGLFRRVDDAWGRVDLLFNNAGTSAPPVPIEELSFEDWNKVVGANLTGSFLCAQRAVSAMKRQQPSGGRIINNGSVSAYTPRPNSAPYTATKHAITGLTKSLALDGRGHGITCGQIDIGNAATEMTVAISNGVPQADGSLKGEATMDAQDVGRAVAYMAALPRDTNVLSMTIMASEMPFVGRG